MGPTGPRRGGHRAHQERSQNDLYLRYFSGFPGRPPTPQTTHSSPLLGLPGPASLSGVRLLEQLAGCTGIAPLYTHRSTHPVYPPVVPTWHAHPWVMHVTHGHRDHWDMYIWPFLGHRRRT